MIELLLQQLGITPDQIEKFKAMALDAGQKISGVDARLIAIEHTLAAIAAHMKIDLSEIPALPAPAAAHVPVTIEAKKRAK